MRTGVTVGASNELKTVIHGGLSDNDTVASGYSVSAGSQAGERSEGERSPFAPQTPGRNKKQ